MRHAKKIKELYRQYIRSSKNEARFLTLLAFTITFVFARISVYGIRYHFLPFSNLFYKDIHIHHLVFGIIFLLIAGLIRVPEWNTYLVRFSSVIYGIGAALTLDEFSLWLRLDPDVYFGHEGRASIDAVVLFILILMSTMWYGTFWRKLFTHASSYLTFNKKGNDFMRIKSGINKIFLIAGVSILALYIGILFMPRGKINSEYKIKLHDVKKSVLATTIQIPSTSTPSVALTIVSPSPTATPSPTISGYCLNVPVLMYHHIEPSDIARVKGQTSLNVDNGIFDQQMAYLASHGYISLTSDQLANALRNHTSLPAKSVVVTLDDAYDDNYTYAFPILKRYHIIGSFMIPTGLVGVHTLGNSYMTWDQLREIATSGIGEMQDHTWSHYALGGGTVEKNQFEIMTSKQQLEQSLGKHVDIFTYPYGSGSQTPWVINLLKSDGFIAAFSTIGGTMQCDGFIYSLHRNHVGSAMFPGYGIY